MHKFDTTQIFAPLTSTPPSAINSERSLTKNIDKTKVCFTCENVSEGSDFGLIPSILNMLLPPASVVEVIELVLSLCVSVCVCVCLCVVVCLSVIHT